MGVRRRLEIAPWLPRPFRAGCGTLSLLICSGFGPVAPSSSASATTTALADRDGLDNPLSPRLMFFGHRAIELGGCADVRMAHVLLDHVHGEVVRPILPARFPKEMGRQIHIQLEAGLLDMRSAIADRIVYQEVIQPWLTAPSVLLPSPSNSCMSFRSQQDERRTLGRTVSREGLTN